MFLLQVIQMAPEYMCWRLFPEIVPLHVIGNLTTFGSYMLLGLGLGLLSIVAEERFDRVLILCFSAFITFCGVTHFLDYYVIFDNRLFGLNAFYLLGWAKVATGAVSLFTVITFMGYLAQQFQLAHKRRKEKGKKNEKDKNQFEDS